MEVSRITMGIMVEELYDLTLPTNCKTVDDFAYVLACTREKIKIIAEELCVLLTADADRITL